MKPVLPGGTLGVLGGGQLGRMLALAARRMGYRVRVYAPEPDAAAGQVAELTCAPYADLEAVRAFAASVDVLSVEFENVPVAALEAAAEVVPVRPGPTVLHVAQNRLREKAFLEGQGLPVAPYAAIGGADELAPALARLDARGVLKTAGFGYDGKGQRVVGSVAEARDAYAELGGGACVLEAFVPFEHELSVVAARGVTGEVAVFDVLENAHVRHILDVSSAPAEVPEAVRTEAREIARVVLEALDLVGVLCVEFFLTGAGELVINEIAPRPHNSGHLSIEAHATSQFEQQLRAVCGLPLGSPELLRPAAMANLLGELWRSGEPNWARVLARPGVALHLYGKQDARPGRKMGHLTALGESAEAARAQVLAARAALLGR